MATKAKEKMASLSNMVRVGDKKRRRVGRGTGSGSGKTSGRGHKGQGSRSGGSVNPRFEGGHTPLYRLIPKKRGFHSRFAKESVLNVDELDKHFKAGDTVTRKKLIEARLMHRNIKGVKILGEGEISKKMTVIVNHMSKQAKVKIEKAGGTVKLIASLKISSKKVETSDKTKGVAGDVQKVS